MYENTKIVRAATTRDLLIKYYKILGEMKGVIRRKSKYNLVNYLITPKSLFIRSLLVSEAPAEK